MNELELGVHERHAYVDQAPGSELQAWVAPRTWVAGEVVSASTMNSAVRDLFAYLGGGDAVATTPPGSPVLYQRWVYQAPTGEHFLCIYRNDLDATYPWHVHGGTAILSTGSLSGTWNGFADLSGSYAVTRAGHWECTVGGGGGGGSQGAASMRLLYNAVQVDASGGNFSSGNNTGFAAVYIGALAAAQVIKVQGNNTNVVSYSYSMNMLIRPKKIA